MDENLEYLLKEAANKIKSLKRENEIMRTRLEMFDQMMRVFNTVPVYQGYMHEPDTAYEIEQYLEKQKPNNKENDNIQRTS